MENIGPKEALRTGRRDIAPERGSQGAVPTREVIILAAIEILTHRSADALTTRAVASSAKVQLPTIYRLFGDKNGLLDAVAEYGFRRYLAEKERHSSSDDPIEAYREGWDLHVDFGLANPAMYAIMFFGPGRTSTAAEMSYGLLRRHIKALATVGHLRMSEERASHLSHATATGIVMSLLRMPADKRDLELSAAAREAVIGAITEPVSPLKSDGLVASAVALRAALSNVAVLSGAEKQLLAEWLDRLAH